jgi:ornithine cyclodeaminase/alanine dehydrogenase-like protein (mu-crystallin family)
VSLAATENVAPPPRSTRAASCVVRPTQHRACAHERGEAKKVLVLDHKQAVRALPMAECIEVMANALEALAIGQVHLPLRTVLSPPNAESVMALMSAYRFGEHPVYGVKTICVFPQNSQLGKDYSPGFGAAFYRAAKENCSLM